jgi:hypothetical protein
VQIFATFPRLPSAFEELSKNGWPFGKLFEAFQVVEFLGWFESQNGFNSGRALSSTGSGPTAPKATLIPTGFFS